MSESADNPKHDKGPHSDKLHTEQNKLGTECDVQQQTSKQDGIHDETDDSVKTEINIIKSHSDLQLIKQDRKYKGALDTCDDVCADGADVICNKHESNSQNITFSNNKTPNGNTNCIEIPGEISCIKGQIKALNKNQKEGQHGTKGENTFIKEGNQTTGKDTICGNDKNKGAKAVNSADGKEVKSDAVTSSIESRPSSRGDKLLNDNVQNNQEGTNNSETCDNPPSVSKTNKLESITTGASDGNRLASQQTSSQTSQGTECTEIRPPSRQASQYSKENHCYNTRPVGQSISENQGYNSRPASQSSVEKQGNNSRPARQSSVEKQGNDSRPASQSSVEKQGSNSRPARQSSVEKQGNNSRPARQSSVEKQGNNSRPASQSSVEKQGNNSRPARQSSVEKQGNDSRPASQSSVEKQGNNSRPARQSSVEKKGNDSRPASQSSVEKQIHKSRPIGQSNSEKQGYNSRPASQSSVEKQGNDSRPASQSSVEKQIHKSRPIGQSNSEKQGYNSRPASQSSVEKQGNDSRPASQSSVEKQIHKSRPIGQSNLEKQGYNSRPASQSSVEKQGNDSRPASQCSVNDSRPVSQCSVEKQGNDSRSDSESRINNQGQKSTSTSQTSSKHQGNNSTPTGQSSAKKKSHNSRPQSQSKIENQGNNSTPTSQSSTEKQNPKSKSAGQSSTEKHENNSRQDSQASIDKQGPYTRPAGQFSTAKQGINSRQACQSTVENKGPNSGSASQSSTEKKGNNSTQISQCSIEKQRNSSKQVCQSSVQKQTPNSRLASQASTKEQGNNSSQVSQSSVQNQTPDSRLASQASPKEQGNNSSQVSQSSVEKQDPNSTLDSEPRSEKQGNSSRPSDVEPQKEKEGHTTPASQCSTEKQGHTSRKTTKLSTENKRHDSKTLNIQQENKDTATISYETKLNKHKETNEKKLSQEHDQQMLYRQRGKAVNGEIKSLEDSKVFVKQVTEKLLTGNHTISSRVLASQSEPNSPLKITKSQICSKRKTVSLDKHTLIAQGNNIAQISQHKSSTEKKSHSKHNSEDKVHAALNTPHKQKMSLSKEDIKDKTEYSKFEREVSRCSSQNSDYNRDSEVSPNNVKKQMPDQYSKSGTTTDAGTRTSSTISHSGITAKEGANSMSSSQSSLRRALQDAKGNAKTESPSDSLSSDKHNRQQSFNREGVVNSPNRRSASRSSRKSTSKSGHNTMECQSQETASSPSNKLTKYKSDSQRMSDHDDMNQEVHHKNSEHKTRQISSTQESINSLGDITNTITDNKDQILMKPDSKEESQKSEVKKQSDNDSKDTETHSLKAHNLQDGNCGTNKHLKQIIRQDSIRSDNLSQRSTSLPYSTDASRVNSPAKEQIQDQRAILARTKKETLAKRHPEDNDGNEFNGENSHKQDNGDDLTVSSKTHNQHLPKRQITSTQSLPYLEGSKKSEGTKWSGPGHMYMSVQNLSSVDQEDRLLVCPIKPPRRSRSEAMISDLSNEKGTEKPKTAEKPIAKDTKPKEAVLYRANTESQGAREDKHQIISVRKFMSETQLNYKTPETTNENNILAQQPYYQSELPNVIPKYENMSSKKPILRAKSEKYLSSAPKKCNSRSMHELRHIAMSSNDLGGGYTSMMSGLSDRSETMSELTQLSHSFSELSLLNESSARATVMRKRPAEDPSERCVGISLL